MEYLVADFKIECPDGLLQTARDLLADAAGDVGFESFEDTESGIKGYVQRQLFDKSKLDNALSSFPLQDTSVSYNIQEVEDNDWNETWEKEWNSPTSIYSLSPSPSPVGEGSDMPKRITIIPYTSNNESAEHITPLPHRGGAGGEAFIFIDPRLAFGSGTHETTQMIVSTLLGMDMKGKRVLDCGCGTGILSISACVLGAREAVAYDIDEWSVENTRHNALLNNVDNIEVLHGDASVLDNVDGLFDIVLANINRNILLHDMPSFKAKMKPGGILIVSGFYEEDVRMLEDKALQLGLKAKAVRDKGKWRMIEFCENSE